MLSAVGQVSDLRWMLQRHPLTLLQHAQASFSRLPSWLLEVSAAANTHNLKGHMSRTFLATGTFYTALQLMSAHLSSTTRQSPSFGLAFDGCRVGSLVPWQTYCSQPCAEKDMTDIKHRALQSGSAQYFVWLWQSPDALNGTTLSWGLFTSSCWQKSAWLEQPWFLEKWGCTTTEY